MKNSLLKLSVLMIGIIFILAAIFSEYYCNLLWRINPNLTCLNDACDLAVLQFEHEFKKFSIHLKSYDPDTIFRSNFLCTYYLTESIEDGVKGKFKICENFIEGVFSDVDHSYEIAHDEKSKSTVLFQVDALSISRNRESSSKTWTYPFFEEPVRRGYLEVTFFYDSYLLANFSNNMNLLFEYFDKVVALSSRFLKQFDFSLSLVDRVFVGNIIDRNLSKLINLERFVESYHVYGRWNKFDLSVLMIGINSAYMHPPETVGMAFIRGVCKRSWNGIIMFPTRSIYISAIILAHEIGHTLGMSHDTPECVCNRSYDCIMQSFIVSNPDISFSTCSLRQLAEQGSIHRPFCVRNFPRTRIAICGNGVVEGTEQCDCLSPACAVCCKNCTLTHGSTCGSGVCCDLKSCKPFPKEAKVRCKNRDNVCGITHNCDGLSSECPSVHIHDGLPCETELGKGFCHGGICGSHDLACKLFFEKSQKGDQKCYDRNMAGNKFYNCGPPYVDRLPPSFIPCSKSNSLCGVLQCLGRFEPQDMSSSANEFNCKQNFEPKNDKKNIFSDLLGISTMYDGFCTALSIGLNLVQVPFDPTYVPNGSPCGNGSICVNQSCQPLKPILSKNPCPITCKQPEWVCGNDGKCYEFISAEVPQALLPDWAMILAWLSIGLFFIGASMLTLHPELRGPLNDKMLLIVDKEKKVKTKKSINQKPAK